MLLPCNQVVHISWSSKDNPVINSGPWRHMGSGGTDPHILKAWYYMEVSGQLHTLAALLMSKVLLLPTKQQVCTGFLPTCCESNPDYSAVWPLSYSLGQLSYPESLSCPGQRLSQLGNVMVFLCLTRQMPAQYLELGNDCCLTHPFLFIIYNQIIRHDRHEVLTSTHFSGLYKPQ
jgi:hypothetical protein